ncbi:hypothetical protein Pst134EB_029637 [Puccinia striiformis f. sp. tritici]|nr:hypothetical protein Pst134EB_029637 [Puccinia striiformis f. sp. tritici]
MDLALLVLPFLVFEVIMGITIDPTFRKLNKFKSRSIHPNEALESNTGGGPSMSLLTYTYFEILSGCFVSSGPKPHARFWHSFSTDIHRHSQFTPITLHLFPILNARSFHHLLQLVSISPQPIHFWSMHIALKIQAVEEKGGHD